MIKLGPTVAIIAVHRWMLTLSRRGRGQCGEGGAVGRGGALQIYVVYIGVYIPDVSQVRN